MTAYTLAITLLCIRFAALGLLSAVLVKQLQNIKAYDTDYPSIRYTILILTIILTVGQLVPILLDGSALFAGVQLRASHPAPLATAYTLNNAVKDLAIGILLCFLYFRNRSTDE
jgi:hypothetical protein